MAFRRLMLLGVLVAVALGIMTPLASASSFSSVIVYGDSLSDNGNLFNLIGYPPAPYFDGRFSNGPVAVEQVAAALGVPLIDFAVGGATTGMGNFIDGGTQTTPGSAGLPGMMQELALSAPLLTPATTSSALFVVWGGANDFFSGGSPVTAATNLDSIIATLEGAGAQHILVPGMPDLGLTPEFYGNAAATAYSEEFNSLLLASLPSNVTYADTFNLLRAVNSDPSAYGFSDVTDACFNGVTVCANPGQFFFWDDVHPTTAADALVAKQFEASLVQTPEPAPILLIGTGLSALALIVRRRAA
ncbi:MAG TPA: SGNH/GDSL hydrolase family protein [Edaphobacter sp.]|nr:SGNH/GDSL hydrolase family protein [Edaphobacter sp.]